MFDTSKTSLNLFEALLEEIDVDSGLNAKNALLQSFAHTKEIGKNIINETLLEHSQRSLMVFHYLCDNNLISFEFINEKFKQTYIKFLEIIIYFHDFGKLNSNFQDEKMKNKINFNYFQNYEWHTDQGENNGKEFIKTSSNHSRFNIYIFLENQPKSTKLLNYIEFENIVTYLKNSSLREKDYLKKEIFNFFNFFTKKHHDGLTLLDNFKIERLKLLFNEDFNDFSFFMEYTHSIIINADVIATKYFMENNTNKIPVEDYLKHYFNNTNLSIPLKSFEKKCFYNIPIYKSNELPNFNDIKTLNELKYYNAKIIKQNLKISNKISFYYGKTGIGKTNLSFVIANEYFKENKLHLNKIIYVAPLNNLIYQTKESILTHLDIKESDITIVNSIEKVDLKRKSDCNLFDNYSYQNFNNSLILTTSINFFEKLFHKDKKDISPLLYLKDSFIIIDELQLMNDKYFNLCYHYLFLLKKYLNCKIVVMSATIPTTTYIKEQFKNEFETIINEEELNKINSHELLNRYEYNLNYLDKQDTILKDLIEKTQNDDETSILVVHNTINKLNLYYEENKELLEKNGYKVLFYNNHIIKPNLDYTLNAIRNKKYNKVIVFATKKIEAGVDISFKFGIKFFDSFDAIEQFAGRINRYNTYKESLVYIVNDIPHFNGQQRDKIIKEISKDKDSVKKDGIISKYLKNINQFYLNLFNKNNDESVDLVKYIKHKDLNEINLINDYKKDKFFIDVVIENLNLEFFDANFLELVKEHGIKNSKELLYEKYVFYPYLSYFLIDGFISKNSNFYKNEYKFLTPIDISLSKKFVDEVKILSSENYYYDIERGFSFNKEIQEEEIIDTFNI